MAFGYVMSLFTRIAAWYFSGPVSENKVLMLDCLFFDCFEADTVLDSNWRTELSPAQQKFTRTEQRTVAHGARAKQHAKETHDFDHMSKTGTE